MGNRIHKAVGGELAFNRLTRSAGAVAVGIAALNHETFHNAVKCQTVIKSVVRQRDKIINRFRRGVAVQRDFNYAVIFHRNHGVIRAVRRVDNLRAVFGLLRRLRACIFIRRFPGRKRKNRKYAQAHAERDD